MLLWLTVLAFAVSSVCQPAASALCTERDLTCMQELLQGGVMYNVNFLNNHCPQQAGRRRKCTDDLKACDGGVKDEALGLLDLYDYICQENIKQEIGQHSQCLFEKKTALRTKDQNCWKQYKALRTCQELKSYRSCMLQAMADCCPAACGLRDRMIYHQYAINSRALPHCSWPHPTNNCPSPGQRQGEA